MTHLSPADRDALTQRLDAMKRRALDEIRDASADIEANRPQEHEVQVWADGAETERLDEVRLAEIEIDRATLHEIEQAQQRIADGRYGQCEACNEPIPAARLMVHPTAIRCAACQGALEAEARRAR